MKKKTTLNRFVNKLALGLSIAELAFFSCSSLPQPKLEDKVLEPLTATESTTNYQTSTESIQLDTELFPIKEVDGKTKRGYEAYLPRISPYDQIIDRESRKVGENPNFIRSLILVESKGDPRARPIKKDEETGRYVALSSAAGLGQFIKSTGRSYDLQQTKYTDDRFLPEKAIPAVVAHIADLRKRHKTDEKVLLAYHTNPPSWYIPAVKELTHALDTGEVRYVAQPSYAKRLRDTKLRTLREGETFSSIARTRGISLDELKELNLHVVDYNRVGPDTPIRVPTRSYKAIIDNTT